MSTFRGRLVDPALYFLAIDDFGPHVYDCDMFLLSHHHTDHMKGLDQYAFCKLVNESPTKTLYCSPITAHFLRRMDRCTIHDDKIVPLEINKAFVLQPECLKTNLNVTCLPAAHCPGSVMFLIEYEGRRILYSGDIRLTTDDIQNIVGTLTNSDQSIIKIDDLYLDTTFAIPTHMEDFPSREASELTVIDFVGKFLSSSPNRRVVLEVSANFGYESLFMKLSKTFGKPVVVHDKVMSCYKGIEEIRDHVSASGDGAANKCNWLMHACFSPQKCEHVRFDERTRVFKLCAFGFLSDSIENVKIHPDYNVPYQELSLFMTKVFYSTHCSLNELRQFYSYLRPKRVFPSVRVNQSSKDILQLIGVQDKDYLRGLQCSTSLRQQRQGNREGYDRRCAEARKMLNEVDSD